MSPVPPTIPVHDPCSDESDLIDDDRSIEDPQGRCLLKGTVSTPKAVRLDVFLSELGADEGLSRERLKKTILNGFCDVDGRVVSDPSHKLRRGQRVSCSVPVVGTVLQPVPLPVQVVYEDDDLAVVVKPAGLTVHPCPSCHEETFVHRLLFRFPALRGFGGMRPGIVHRLDRNTSGLMIIALSERGFMALTDAFARRAIRKTYLALVRGVVSVDGRCDAFIGRHPTLKTCMAAFPDDRYGARPALSEYHRIHADGDGLFSLVSVRIHTGRTHQIRVHMADIGHPLLGDDVYGTKAPFRRPDGLVFADVAPRQMLHAWKLSFEHPFRKCPMDFSVAPPPDFATVEQAMLRRMGRIIITGLPGCGKSAVTAFLKERMPVWSADAVVAELYKRNGKVVMELKRRYASDLVDAYGNVNKEALFAAMSDDDFRRELERLVHPLIAEDLHAFFLSCEQGGAPYAAAEVPLWFESPYMHVGETRTTGHFVVGVRCSSEIRHARLRTIRHWSEAKIATMDAWQWDEKRKMGACDALLANEASLDALGARITVDLPGWQQRMHALLESMMQHLQDSV